MAGEDFGKVAGEVSDSASKANGGLIGPFSRDDMSPQMQELLDKMKPGDITPAIRTPRGYQILKLETLKVQTVQPFDKVRDLIADKVASERTRNEMRKFLTRLRAQAIIEWKNDELKKAYEKQLAADDAAVSVEPVNVSGRSLGTRSGRGRDTSRSSAISSNARATKRFSRPSRAGAGGRIGGRRSTGRCFQATASRASSSENRLPVQTCTGVVSIVVLQRRHCSDSRPGDRCDPAARAKRSSVRSVSAHS